MRRFLPLLLIALITCNHAFAQERKISGTVTSSEDGTGIPGASVLLKGTSLGSITDIDGHYTLSVPPQGGTLVFSFVGFLTQEVTITASNVVNITLQVDSKQLTEVVVTGYGDPQSKKITTGSMARISTGAIQNVPMPTFDQILQGRAPGLMVSVGSGQPGTAANVRIRGIGSIDGGTAPLYIMDGVPIAPGDFSTINPNDIEDIDILKDASATSIYGSRAANGVILITTRRGKENGVKLKYSFQYGITERTNTRFKMMNTIQKIQFERTMAKFGLYQGSVGDILSDTDLSSSQKEQQIAELSRTNTDWTDVFFRTGRTQMHEISATVGAGKTNYFISANYRSEEGIIKRSSLDRYTFRFNLDQQATEKFSFGMSNQLGYSKSSFLPTETGNNVNNPVLYAFIANPYTRVKNPETGQYEDGPTGFNLVEQMNESHNLTYQVKVISSMYLRYAIMKDLVVKTNWGIDYSQSTDDFRINAGAPNQEGINGLQGVITQNYSRLGTAIGTTTLQYSRILTDKQSIRVLVGQELIRSNSRGFGFNGYGLNDKIKSAAAITQGTETNDLIAEVSGSNTDNALLSYFLDGVYSFGDRYNITVGVRRDGSSRFGSNKRYALFYSAGASWNVINEAFMEDLPPIFDDLKVRVSYGTQGNQSGIGNFSYLATYGTGYNYAGDPGIAPENIGNPNYQWESKTSTDVGIDFSILSSRISGTVDFYNNITSDLFLGTQLSSTSGFLELPRNVGKMRNRGLEFSLNTTNLVRPHFKWTTSINFTINKNKILDLFQEDEIPQGTFIIREGLPYGSHYIVEWAGVNPANGDPLYKDKNGNVTNVYNSDNAVAKFGTWDPPRFGGINSDLTYKNFQLSLFFSFQQGNKLFNNQRFFMNNPRDFGGFNQSTEQLKAWQKPGDITNVARVDAQREFSSQDIEDASFLRLRNVVLSYMLPQPVLSRLKLASVRVYVQGQNVWTLTKYSGYDPEDSNNVQLSQYPVPRVFTAGVDVGF